MNKRIYQGPWYQKLSYYKKKKKKHACIDVMIRFRDYSTGNISFRLLCLAIFVYSVNCEDFNKTKKDGKKNLSVVCG